MIRTKRQMTIQTKRHYKPSKKCILNFFYIMCRDKTNDKRNTVFDKKEKKSKLTYDRPIKILNIMTKTHATSKAELHIMNHKKTWRSEGKDIKWDQTNTWITNKRGKSYDEQTENIIRDRLVAKCGSRVCLLAQRSWRPCILGELRPRGPPASSPAAEATASPDECSMEINKSFLYTWILGVSNVFFYT